MALARRQELILVWMLEQERERPGGAWPPSEIAYGIGMNRLPAIHGSGSGSGRGSGPRVFNPAQRIISSLTGLSGRGLIRHGKRRDGMSGSAYGLTEKGRDAAAHLAG